MDKEKISSSSVEEGRLPTKSIKSCIFKWFVVIATIVIAIALLLFVLVFVGVPLAFKYSVKIQRMFIFMPIDTTPEQFEYLHNHANGSRNFYVSVETPDNITLGLLHFLPLPLISQSVENEKFSYSDALAMPDYPVLLHFHGNGGNRFYNVEMYLKLRQYFHVIGFDYQSYGDSTKCELTELGIVEVSIELYKWLVVQTAPDNIYVWGHSLGGAIAAHTLARLKYENIVPKGLVLEATFPSLRDEVENYGLAKAFTWLPWFESTIQDSLIKSGYIFNTSCHVTSVDCPIMILHAEDDALIPYTLAEKLNDTVSGNRNNFQGNVTFYGISSAYECSHWSIMQWPMFHNCVENYILDCEEYYNKSKSLTPGTTGYNVSILYNISTMPPITTIKPYDTTTYKISWDIQNNATYLFFLLFLVVFLVMFVTVPILIKRSLDLQRSLIFPTNYQIPADPDFDDFKKYNIKGARNLHVLVDKEVNISLGVWHLLPHTLVNDSILNEDFNYSKSLALSQYPVVMHFHNNRINRAKPLNSYNFLRTIFHVIAFDYRGYGDSTETEPSESTVVQDSIGLYKWLRNQTKVEIYFWGHAFGGSISTHTIAKLHEEGIVPMGLFLEAPFTSMKDQIQQTSFFKFFAWLPWYESTMVYPLERNGFIFNTTDYIKKVNCPIMITHAEDDTVTPYQFSEELVEVAREGRTEDKGNVTFYLLPRELQCGHFALRKAPRLIYYIRDHIRTCQLYNKAEG